MSCPLPQIQPHAEFDPNLTKPVRFVAPPSEMPAAERARLESEKASLQRELATTQRGIDHITDLLAA